MAIQSPHTVTAVLLLILCSMSASEARARKDVLDSNLITRTEEEMGISDDGVSGGHTQLHPSAL